jgi:hypothetical protein
MEVTPVFCSGRYLLCLLVFLLSFWFAVLPCLFVTLFLSCVRYFPAPTARPMHALSSPVRLGSPKRLTESGSAAQLHRLRLPRAIDQQFH